jgi:hypothetical protein
MDAVLIIDLTWNSLDFLGVGLLGNTRVDVGNAFRDGFGDETSSSSTSFTKRLADLKLLIDFFFPEGVEFSCIVGTRSLMRGR